MKNVYVVIPCYRVGHKIIGVVAEVLDQSLVRQVVVVDDACPDQTHQLVREQYAGNLRVKVLRNPENKGVGGAVLAGYQYAFANGADIAIKIDGDGQMEVDRIPAIIKPIVDGKCDYTKGNRFYYPKHLSNMPVIRFIGNSGLSLINKLASGYWSIMDPTNGYTALHKSTYFRLEHNDIAHDYFFESDMLYQLGIVQAVVRDIPMPAIYEDEISSLSISSVLIKFPGRYFKRMLKRLVLRYFIRDFNFASLEIFSGSILFFCGLFLGLYKWISNLVADVETPTGTVMIVGIFMLIGFQLLLSALNYDVSNEPSVPLSYLELD